MSSKTFSNHWNFLILAIYNSSPHEKLFFMIFQHCFGFWSEVCRFAPQNVASWLSRGYPLTVWNNPGSSKNWGPLQFQCFIINFPTKITINWDTLRQSNPFKPHLCMIFLLTHIKTYICKEFSWLFHCHVWSPEAVYPIFWQTKTTCCWAAALCDSNMALCFPNLTSIGSWLCNVWWEMVEENRL